MIVTIDGPAGAGKSSVARQLAERLGFRFLDTGAMYRAVAWAALQAGCDPEKRQSWIDIARTIDLELDDTRVIVDGQDVTHAIRTPEVTSAVRWAANNSGVREILVAKQRQIGVGGNLVTEGRDQGTVVFPDAACKIYLTASPEERARRRHQELLDQGAQISFADVLDSQNRRDREDSQRRVGPLEQAADAIEVLTDGMSQEEVIERLVGIVRGRVS